MARGAVGVAGDRSLMVLRAIEIEPEHRGVDLALVVADRLVDLYASGLVVCRSLALAFQLRAVPRSRLVARRPSHSGARALHRDSSRCGDQR